MMKVPNRSKILFHWGNTCADTEGCILVGTLFGERDNILLSKPAFQAFMNALTSVEEFELSIDLWQSTNK